MLACEGCDDANLLAWQVQNLFTPTERRQFLARFPAEVRSKAEAALRTLHTVVSKMTKRELIAFAQQRTQGALPRSLPSISTASLVDFRAAILPRLAEPLRKQLLSVQLIKGVLLKELLARVENEEKLVAFLEASLSPTDAARLVPQYKTAFAKSTNQTAILLAALGGNASEITEFLQSLPNDELAAFIQNDGGYQAPAEITEVLGAAVDYLPADQVFDAAFQELISRFRHDGQTGEQEEEEKLLAFLQAKKFADLPSTKPELIAELSRRGLWRRRQHVGDDESSGSTPGQEELPNRKLEQELDEDDGGEVEQLPPQQAMLGQRRRKEIEEGQLASAKAGRRRVHMGKSI